MKTKALISFAVTAKLICVFVFAYAKSRFSLDAAHLIVIFQKLKQNPKLKVFIETSKAICLSFSHKVAHSLFDVSRII